MNVTSNTFEAKREALLRLVREFGSCVVAYSGGVDSAVVAKAAQLALGDCAVAITGESAALATGELEQAREVAEIIGIRHLVVRTDELADPNYAANRPDRCYHCKSELYDRLRVLADEHGIAVVANGANADDLGDFRPGMKAADERRVRSPLAECGITKQEVRQLAANWNLPVAEKPATPCLSSRIAYGQEVTPERLSRIDSAERMLRSLGFRELRVRYHGDDLARIEVPVEQIEQICEPLTRELIADQLKRLGFKYVTIDLAGFRSGGFQQLVPLDVLKDFGQGR